MGDVERRRGRSRVVFLSEGEVDSQEDTAIAETEVDTVYDLRSSYAGKRPATVVIYQHNGFTVSTETNEIAAEVLKKLLIPNLEVKGISIYHGQAKKLERVESLNYTRLTALRAQLKPQPSEEEWASDDS